MNILVFTSLFPNNIWSHHGIFVKERMCHVAALAGCNMKVVAPIPYFPPIKLGHRWLFSQVVRRENMQGVDVYHPRYIMIPKVGMTLYGIMMFLSVLPTLKRLRDTFEFDIIDAHYVYPDGMAAVLLGRYFNKPVVVSARGSDINVFSQLFLIRRLLRYALQKADCIIAVSAALREEILQLNIPASKVCVIQNGVDTAKFYPISKPEARNRLNLPENAKLVLSVGNLTRNKGFALLIQAFQTLVRELEGTNLHLVIIGDGPIRSELERVVLSCGLTGFVHLPGDLPHQELFRWYSAADVFCLASEREGWPNVILESLACGTPVVATSVGGIPEIIRCDKVGLLTARNQKKIAETLRLALEKSWESSFLVDYARENSWVQSARSVRSTLESVLAQRDSFSYGFQPSG